MISVNEQQHTEKLHNLEMIMRSDRVYETIYEASSPMVLEWTSFYSRRANIPDIFASSWDHLTEKSQINAAVVGTFWHHFSSTAPQVISLAAGKVSNNLIRHYIVQVLFEELGGRDHRKIHPDLFLDCLEDIGVNDENRNSLIRKHLPKVSLSYLLKIMEEADSDAKVLGILLGLEIDAVENISTIADALSYDSTSKRIIEASTFFCFHKIAEPEHIRLDVANFLRFCSSEREKMQFMEGFDEAVSFWAMYWKGISTILQIEKSS